MNVFGNVIDMFVIYRLIRFMHRLGEIVPVELLHEARGLVTFLDESLHGARNVDEINGEKESARIALGI